MKRGDDSVHLKRNRHANSHVFTFLYWQAIQFGLKPTIHINHLVIDDRPGVTAREMTAAKSLQL
jgi:hypothetical protein